MGHHLVETTGETTAWFPALFQVGKERTDPAPAEELPRPPPTEVCCKTCADCADDDENQRKTRGKLKENHRKPLENGKMEVYPLVMTVIQFAKLKPWPSRNREFSHQKMVMFHRPRLIRWSYLVKRWSHQPAATFMVTIRVYWSHRVNISQMRTMVLEDWPT